MQNVTQNRLVRIWVSFWLLFVLTACSKTHRADLMLGSEQELVGLYSYPNTTTSKESLEDTIKHYLQQTVTRDGLHDSTILVGKSGDQYAASILAPSPIVMDYVERIPTFLLIGKAAYTGAELAQQQAFWQKDWRFFLPLGLPMINQRSIQLLHFPPDYSLPKQDYLGSKTSQRWERLLEANNVPAKEVTLYETIVDIAPIAAPAGDGAKLEPTYRYFQDYAHALLKFLVTPAAQVKQTRSVVAYGVPVHKWVEQQFGLRLTVLSTGQLSLGDGIQAPILGANHPSYFWYAAALSCDLGWDVMREDLIAARWQQRISEGRHNSPHRVLEDATSYWDARPDKICLLTRQQYAGCASKPMRNCPTDK